VVVVVVEDVVLSVDDGAIVLSVLVSAGGAIDVSVDDTVVSEVVLSVEVLWPQAATLNRHAAAAAANTDFNIGGLLSVPEDGAAPPEG